MLTEELTPILLRLFWKTAEGEQLGRHREAIVPLTPTPDKDRRRKEGKQHGLASVTNTGANDPQQNTSQATETRVRELDTMTRWGLFPGCKNSPASTNQPVPPFMEWGGGT